MFARANIIDNRIFNTIELNVKLHDTNGEPLKDVTLYRQLVGSLVYLIVIQTSHMLSTLPLNLWLFLGSCIMSCVRIQPLKA